MGTVYLTWVSRLCDDNLNRVPYTRSRSGILSTFPTYIGETVIWGFIWTYVLNFVPCLLSPLPLARLNTNVTNMPQYIMSLWRGNCCSRWCAVTMSAVLKFKQLPGFAHINAAIIWTRAAAIYYVIMLPSFCFLHFISKRQRDALYVAAYSSHRIMSVKRQYIAIQQQYLFAIIK